MSSTCDLREALPCCLVPPMTGCCYSPKRKDGIGSGCHHITNLPMQLFRPVSVFRLGLEFAFALRVSHP
eukprot:3266916-Amphidinium_carterae.1